MNEHDPIKNLFISTRTVASAYCPGRVATAIEIRFSDGGSWPIPLPHPLAALPLDAGPGQAADAPMPSDDEDGPERPPKTIRAMGDILDALAETKRPMTSLMILSHLARKNIEWSQRTVDAALAQMAEDGTLSNPKDPKRPGFCLPEHDPRIRRDLPAQDG